MTINCEQDPKKRRIEHYINWALNYKPGPEGAAYLREQAILYRQKGNRLEASAMKQAAQRLERGTV